jgi:hypothetical protein
MLKLLYVVNTAAPPQKRFINKFDEIMIPRYSER